MAPTTPGENALEADEGAKQWARLVAKKPASPKKVTSLAQTTSQLRPKGSGSAGRASYFVLTVAIPLLLMSIVW